MDREHRAGPRHGRPVGRHQLLVGGDQAGLPVVAVDDVERLPQPRRQLHGGAGEEDEPLGVVAVGMGAAIERGAAKKTVVADKQPPRLWAVCSRRERAAKDAGRDRQSPQRHLKGDARGRPA